MTTKINLVLPATIELSSGGATITLPTADVPTETFQHAMEVGLARLASYGYSSVKAASKKAFEDANPGKTHTWLDKDHESLLADIRTRFLDGDWESRRASGVSMSLDPVAKEAHRLAKDFMLTTWKNLTGESTIAKIYEKRDSARDFFNESDGRYVWIESAIAKWLDDNEAKVGFRAQAADIVAKRDLADDMGL